jgi:hypothetical protein
MDRRQVRQKFTENIGHVKASYDVTSEPADVVLVRDTRATHFAVFRICSARARRSDLLSSTVQQDTTKALLPSKVY